jgi:hypothetical protein
VRKRARIFREAGPEPLIHKECWAGLFRVRGAIEPVEKRVVWRDYLAYSAYNLS